VRHVNEGRKRVDKRRKEGKIRRMEVEKRKEEDSRGEKRI